MDNIEIIETTDDMFKVNGTTNIKLYGYPFYFTMLMLYSWITVNLTGTSYFTTPISWLVDMFIFYLWHLQAHHNWNWIPFNTSCHHWHNIHHHKNFPANHFYGSIYAKELIKKFSDPVRLIKYSLPFGEYKPDQSIQNESFGIGMVFIVVLIKYFILKLSIGVISMCIIQGLMVNFIGNYLHLSFHTQNNWLNRFEVYKELKYLHYEHHKDDTKRNYSIFFFGFDKIFNSYYRDYAIKND